MKLLQHLTKITFDITMIYLFIWFDFFNQIVCKTVFNGAIKFFINQQACLINLIYKNNFRIY